VVVGWQAASGAAGVQTGGTRAGADRDSGGGARLPGKQTTTAVSIRATRCCVEKSAVGAEPDDGREHAVAQRAGTRGAEEEREGGAHTRGEKRRQQNNSATERADGTPQPKRQRTKFKLTTR
jgi:hypothetical protein